MATVPGEIELLAAVEALPMVGLPVARPRDVVVAATAGARNADARRGVSALRRAGGGSGSVGHGIVGRSEGDRSGSLTRTLNTRYEVLP